MNKSQNESKNAIIIDVDGTMYDSFKKDDRKIIRDIFGYNGFVSKMDNILWTINSLDFISNSVSILKLRFALYSIIGKEKYKKVYNEYELKYKEMLRKAIESMDKDKIYRLSKGYNIIIFTNNPFSVSVLKKYFSHVVFSSNAMSRKEAIIRINKSANVKYVIGNNFMDDINLSRIVNAESIYIGSSYLGRIYNSDYYVESFDEALSSILDKM